MPAQRDPLQGSEGQKQEQDKNDRRKTEICHVSPKVRISIRALLKGLAFSLMTVPSLFFPCGACPFVIKPLRPASRFDP
jgi:hypothetical protein